MKKLLFAFVLIGFCLFANPQLKAENISLGGDIGLALPVGDFGNAAGLGFGIDAKAIFPINPDIAIGASIGYYSWGEKVTGISYSNIPIAGTFMYFVSQGPSRFYIGSDLSINMLSVKIDFGGFFGSQSSTETYVGLAPLVGIIHPINDNMNLTGTVKYNIIFSSGNSISFISIRGGLMFRLK
jgi:hypothetical protein